MNLWIKEEFQCINGKRFKPQLNTCDLWYLKLQNWHPTTARATLAGDYIGKPLSSITITKMALKTLVVQKRGRLLWALRHLAWIITQWKWVLWKKWMNMNVVRSEIKDEKNHSDCYQGLSWYPDASILVIDRLISRSINQANYWLFF